MGTQEEISKCLQEGLTPQQIINKGYRKSTVYKIYDTFKTYIAQVGKPDWSINGINFNNPNKRFLPLENISVSFNFENTSDKDMYINRLGIWVEWFKSGEWYAQDVKDLVKSGQRRFFSFIIAIPGDVSLGEYELRFGVEAQYLPAIGYQGQSLQTQWGTDPVIIHIKHPLAQNKVFISHSTMDMSLIRQLEEHLDNYGLEPIIAEDIQTPGVLLWEKFQVKIKEATIFLVLFTENSINSKWVIEETNFAYRTGKIVIPLKEENVHEINNDIEWIKYSKNERPEIIFSKIMNGINSRLNTNQVSPQNNAVTTSPSQDNTAATIIGLGIFAFLLHDLFAGKK